MSEVNFILFSLFRMVTMMMVSVRHPSQLSGSRVSMPRSSKWYGLSSAGKPAAIAPVAMGNTKMTMSANTTSFFTAFPSKRSVP